MAFNNNSSTDLSRYSIGEIQDLSGVASFYNAGSSKWLRSATYVDGSLLSTSIKATLAASQTAPTTVALATANDIALNAQVPVLREKWQECKIDSISTTVLARALPTSSANVLTLTSAGAQGITVASGLLLNTGDGASFTLVSNGSKFFIYYFTNTTTMACKSSTDGITWSTETLTNLPTIVGMDSNSAFWDWSQSNFAYPDFGFAYATQNAESYGVNAVLWCGARFLMITRGAASLAVASLSTNGIAWSSSTDTTAVLGSAAIAFPGNHINFYRNGNNCYLALGANYRYSSDGGVTWAASTATLNPASAGNVPNVTDPTKRIITQGGNANAYYTSNSGQTWSASRTLPQTSRWGLAYRGSTVVSGYNNGCFRSVDDGVTWTSIIFPAGTNTSNGQILADAYRFYFVPTGQSQILTSTDAITWTIVSIAGNVNAIGYTCLFSVSSNVAYISTQGSPDGGVFTLDGGVTWAFAKAGNVGVGTNCIGYTTTPTTYGGTGGYIVESGGNTTSQDTFLLSVAALTAGGGFYRTGSTTIAPARTNAIAYVRVG